MKNKLSKQSEHTAFLAELKKSLRLRVSAV